MSTQTLRYRCEQPAADLLEGARYRYIDRGASILGVAHCDYVGCGLKHFAQRGNKVYSTRLDDRLGVHLLLDQLPKMGIRFDVLLTDDEEIGQSTASEFVAPSGKRYNWIFQFDRRGTDCVTYDFDGMIPHVEKYFRHGRGTFSDICQLEHLGCGGMNIGTGYYHEHTSRSFADLGETYQQCKRFAKFFAEYQGTHIPHEPVAKYSHYYRDYGPLTDWSQAVPVTPKRIETKKSTSKKAQRKRQRRAALAARNDWADGRYDPRWDNWNEYATLAHELGFENITEVLRHIGEDDYERAFDYLDAMYGLPPASRYSL